MSNSKTCGKEEFFCKMTKEYSDLDPLKSEMMSKLFLLNDDLVDMKQRALAEHNVSEGRLMVLVSLWSQSAPIKATDLAESIGVTKATVTGLIDSLMNDGYVQKKDCESDRRAAYLHLTEKGQAFLNVVLPDHAKKISDLAHVLSNQEAEQFLKILIKLRSFIANIRKDL